jgi:hypothetical protein
MSADPYSLLLESFNAGSTGGADAQQQLLAQMGETDPRIGLLSKYLASRREAEVETDADEDVSASVEALEREKERQEAMCSLQRVARSMYAELERLRERNDTLASALGACYLCWGEDAICEVCGGRGTPGSLPPEDETFSTLVVPAVRRMQQRRAGAQPSPAPAQPGANDRAVNSNENSN